MRFIFSFIYICLLKDVYSYDSDSTEVNRIEITPFYDTIIVSDIADLLNEFQNTNALFDAFVRSESESDENIEDLLSEYHNYLEKAHNQRKTYLEKSNIKNKYPHLRHDKYVKTKPSENVKYNNNSHKNLFSPSDLKFPHAAMSNPLDLLIPIISKENKPGNANHRDNPGDFSIINTIMRERVPIEGPLTILNSRQEPIKSCYCKTGQIPCKCGCKQCVLPFDVFHSNPNDVKSIIFDKKLSEFQQNFLYNEKLHSKEHVPEEVLNDSVNNINIRLKVDIQLPKLQDAWTRFYRTRNYDGTLEPEINSKEISTINLPLSSFNFPITMDLFGYKKPSTKFNKHDNIHKITIHKNRRSKFNTNKKNRKKVITFHNVKITSPVPPITLQENNNYTNINYYQSFNKDKTVTSNKIIYTNSLVFPTIPTNLMNDTTNFFIISAQKNDNKTHENNNTQTVQQNNFTVNLLNNSDINTDEFHKIENSIETEYRKANSFNVTTEISILRGKRGIGNQTTTAEIRNSTVEEENNIQKTVESALKIITDKNNIKKSEKILVDNSELLYWPNLNTIKIVNITNNITKFILEREIKNNKLNISTETIRHNHTMALAQALFGKVNWDDVDTVVPAFISFVGKYIKGVLTLCSQKTCHSIKCEQKKCMYRICDPENRLNKKGHCIGSNVTDSIASMEYIMDLPSNVAFEIMDILQHNMLGKLFGKVTLCISSKCSTFMVSKKYFMKSKCITKTLDETGHCPNLKNAKNM